MSPDQSPSTERSARVLRFPSRRARARLSPSLPSPVNDLAKFEHSDDVDDYRHRMVVNFAAFVFILVLIAAGLWLADTMAQMRKDQDCVLSGRRGCTPVEVHSRRW